MSAGASGGIDTSPQLDPQDIIVKMPSPKRSWMVTLIGLAFWALIAYVCMQILIVWADNSAVLEWWKKGTGIGKKYNDYFNVWYVLLHKQASWLTKHIIGIFIPAETQWNGSQIDFTTEVLFRFMRLTLDGKQAGVMTPRHIAESILMQYDDGDEAFQAWCAKNEDRRIWNPNNANDPDFYMQSTYISEGRARTFTWTSPSCTDSHVGDNARCDKTNKIGIYPKPDDLLTWQCCCQYWMNGDGGQTTWRWTQQTPSNIYILEAADSAAKNEWWDLDKHPDNVFARYGIGFDSPLVVYFCNGLDRAGNVPVDAQALKNLLGTGPGEPGGWSDFLRNLQTSSGDDIKSLIYDRINFQDASTPPNSCSSDIGKGLLAMGGTFLTGMGPLVFGLGPYGAGAAVALAVLSTAVVGAQQFMASKGCQ